MASILPGFLVLQLFLIFVPVNPHTRCKLKLLRLERIKDYLLMEEEFIQNMELKKPREEKQQARLLLRRPFTQETKLNLTLVQEERTKIDEIRGAPLQVGTLEELVDDKHGSPRHPSG